MNNRNDINKTKQDWRSNENTDAPVTKSTSPTRDTSSIGSGVNQRSSQKPTDLSSDSKSQSTDSLNKRDSSSRR